jgi:predicted nucleic acid-binding Zn ribbon protein
MPIYSWVNKKSGKSVEVIRAFADYEKPPTEEEAPEEKEPEWERNIGADITVVKGNGWGNGKGHWIQLLTGGFLLCTQLLDYLV